jgi:hypothetical protein
MGMTKYQQDDPIDNIPDIDESVLLSIRNYTPIDEVDVVTGTCVIKFESDCVNTFNVYKYIDIVEDESIYLKKHGNKCEIVGLASQGSVLSAKVKGYPSRGLDKNKGFSTAVTLDISLKEKNVNVFLFKDIMKLTGCKSEMQALEAFRYICIHLKYMKSKKSVDVCTDIPSIKEMRWGLVNPKFNLGENIDLYKLNSKMKGAGGFLPMYIPVLYNEYVDIKFPCNLLKKGNRKKFRLFRVYRNGNVNMISFSFEEAILLYKYFIFVFSEMYYS